jgi:DNA-binding MarR family transcriptional regulator
MQNQIVVKGYRRLYRSKEFRISPVQLRSGSRRQKLSRARAAIAKIQTVKLGITAAEIARHMGVKTSDITKSLMQ